MSLRLPIILLRTVPGQCAVVLNAASPDESGTQSHYIIHRLRCIL